MKTCFWLPKMKVLLSIITSLQISSLVARPHLDCQQVSALCPGQKVAVQCIIYSEEIVVLDWNVESYCDEIDFNTNDEINSKDCGQDNECGEFCAILRTKQPNFTSELSFVMHEDYNGLHITCTKLQSTSHDSKKCQINLAGLPDPPRNLTKTDCYPVYISWNSPQSMGEVTTPVLFYFVKIMSSRGDIRNYTVNNTFIWLTAEEMNPNLSYTISVSAVNCRGMSPPVEIIMIPNMPPNPTPVTGLQVAVLNNESVLLSWEHNTNDSSCFDIEMNYEIVANCIVSTQHIITVQKGYFYDFRVRKRQAGMPSPWSKPVCVTFSTPPLLLVHSHSVTDENDTLTLELFLERNPVRSDHCLAPSLTNIVISHNASSDDEMIYPFVGKSIQRVHVPIGNKLSAKGTIRLDITAYNKIGAGTMNSVMIIVESKATSAVLLLVLLYVCQLVTYLVLD